jgi:uncharacterized iron-regulated membrane protein
MLATFGATPMDVARGWSPGRRASARKRRVDLGSYGYAMLDILMLAIGLGFFVAAIGYGVACDRL